MGNRSMAERQPIRPPKTVKVTNSACLVLERLWFARDCEPATVQAAIHVFSAAKGSPTTRAREAGFDNDAVEVSSTSLSLMSSASRNLQRNVRVTMDA